MEGMCMVERKTELRNVKKLWWYTVFNCVCCKGITLFLSFPSSLYSFSCSFHCLFSLFFSPTLSISVLTLLSLVFLSLSVLTLSFIPLFSHTVTEYILLSQLISLILNNHGVCAYCLYNQQQSISILLSRFFQSFVLSHLTYALQRLSVDKSLARVLS